MFTKLTIKARILGSFAVLGFGSLALLAMVFFTASTTHAHMQVVSS